MVLVWLLLVVVIVVVVVVGNVTVVGLGIVLADMYLKLRSALTTRLFIAGRV